MIYTMTEQAILKPREAAEYLRLSTSWLAKARASGIGPVFFRAGKTVRYRREDLDAWLTAHQGCAK